jgi:Leucine-rich repeat (LRR) protein
LPKSDRISKAQALGQHASEASELVKGINQKHAATVESLARQYKDVEVQSGLASAELAMPTVRVSWYQPIVGQLRKMPEVIERSGQTIRTATDIARPLVQRWNDFKANVWHHLLHEIEETGKTLEQVGRRLRAARDGEPNQSKSEASDIPADFDQVKASDMIASGITPPASWVPWIDRLDLTDRSIRDAELLENLTSLQSLVMNRTYSFDVQSIGRAKSLSGTQIKDLTSLRSLDKLVHLDIADTTIDNLSPLSSHECLADLDISRTAVVSLDPLSKLTALTVLNLSGTKINNIESLAALKALQDLDLARTMVTDLTVLRGFEKIRRLDMRACPLSDALPLEGLSTLQLLDMSDTGVENLSPLRRLHLLQELRLNRTPVSDLTCLADLSQLKILELDNTYVEDLSPLSGLNSLEVIWLDHTYVRDLGPLAKLPKLREIWINGTRVRDLSMFETNTSVTDIVVGSEGRRQKLAVTLGGRAGILKIVKR